MSASIYDLKRAYLNARKERYETIEKGISNLVNALADDFENFAVKSGYPDLGDNDIYLTFKEILNDLISDIVY